VVKVGERSLNKLLPSGPSWVHFYARRGTGRREHHLTTPTLKAGAVALALVLCFTGVASAAVTRDDRKKARAATRFLTSEQRKSGAIVAFSKIGSTADAIVSLVAARRAPKAIERAVRFLRRHPDGVDTTGETAKVVMALVAAGEEPVLGERDLVSELSVSQQEDGAYGHNGNNDQVNSHALAMLALAAADGPGPNGQAVQWLLDAQCGDGGWQFDTPSGEADDLHCNNGTDFDYTQSDSNTTAYAVQALAVFPGAQDPAVDPFAYFETVRDETKGGWGYTEGFSLTDANSTSLVIQAHAAAGRTLPDGAERALRKLQYGACSAKKAAFAYSWSDENADGKYTRSERTGPDVGATVGAILGLLEKPLPIAEATVRKNEPKPVCGAPLS
jgi:hypothetical protein